MFPGSISIQFIPSMGMILDEEPAGSLLCGFAFAFDRPTILLHPVVTLVLRADLQEFLCRFCSNPSQIYLFHEKF